MRAVAVALALVACQGKDEGSVTDATADADADADTDTDADADTDTDTDTDSDTDTTPTGTWTFDDTKVLVVPDHEGLKLVRNDGSIAFDEAWDGLLGPCSGCGGEGATADGDGLLVAFTTGSGGNVGGIARIDVTAALDWRLDGFGFPHDAIRDPADDTVVLSETTTDRLPWIAGDGSSSAVVRALDGTNPDWPGGLPNGNELFEHDGRTYLLVSHRGGGAPTTPLGHITMWDITTPGSEALVWDFPSTGTLDTPHGCVYRYFDGQWWMIWAHTEGAVDGGSVGLAVTSDPLVLPEYVADLVPSGANAPFAFLRGVELTTDGTLYVTDSGVMAGPGGPGAPPTGRVLVYDLPAGLAPTGASGAVDLDQVEVDLPGGTVLVDELDFPFEGWLWTPTFPL